MAWNMGFEFIQLELDSKVVLTWLTNHNASYLTNMMPLICDCRSLMDQDWEARVQHIYREANECADAIVVTYSRILNATIAFTIAAFDKCG